MATSSLSELRWPLHQRFWVWLLSHGAFSKPAFVFAAGICIRTFVQRDQSLSDVGLAIAMIVVLAAIGSFIYFCETRSLQKVRDRKEPRFWRRCSVKRHLATSCI